MVFTLAVPIRLRRAQVVERNRDAVLAAARRVFIDKGYAGATLEEIAEEAGFSKGVMYSQFESKADLFLHLLERRIEDRSNQNKRVVAQSAGADGLRTLLDRAAEDWLAEMPWFRLLIEFRALAARDPIVNARYAAAHARTLDGLASDIQTLWAKAGLEPNVPVRVMAEFIQALAMGATLERAANPDAMPVEHVSRMVMRAFGFDRDGAGGVRIASGRRTNRALRR